MIVPAKKQTSDYEAGLAVMTFLQTQPGGAADFRTLFGTLGRYIRLTKVDRQRSPSRPGDLKWHTAVRNVWREPPYPPGHLIGDGYLERLEGGEGGYRLTGKPWKPPAQQMGLFDPPPPPPSQSAYIDRFGCLATRCLICKSRNAPYGYGAELRKGVLGEWFCYEHRPEDK